MRSQVWSPRQLENLLAMDIMNFRGILHLPGLIFSIWLISSSAGNIWFNYSYISCCASQISHRGISSSVFLAYIMNSMKTCPSVTFYFMIISFSDIDRKWILRNMIRAVPALNTFGNIHFLLLSENEIFQNKTWRHYKFSWNSCIAIWL